MKCNRWFCALLLVCLLVAAMIPFARAETKLSHSGDLNAEKLSKEEIADLWHEYLIKHRTESSYDAFMDEWGLAQQQKNSIPEPMHWAFDRFWPEVWEDVYAEDPSINAPYVAGKLTDKVQNCGLDYLNLARTLCGVPPVALEEALCESAQHKAVLEGTWDTQSHYLEKPEDMDVEFYQKTQEYDSECLAIGRFSTTTHQYAIQGCLDDTGSTKNLLGVGHRDILLDTRLTAVGFGAALGQWDYISDTAVAFYTAIHGRHDSYFEEYDFLAWPASGNFPSDMFAKDASWSIHLNASHYKFEKENVTVTLTRESDGKVWTFDHTLGPENAYTGGQEAYIDLDEDYYMIVFHPGTNQITEPYQGVYTVRVTGIHQGGTPVELEYQVDFFDMDDYGLHRYDPKKATVSTPDCCNMGFSYNICQDCGNMRFYDFVDATPHQLTEATCAELATCIYCGTKYGEYKPHAWVDATCLAPQTCSACGLTTGSAKGHSMDTSELVRMPSCTETGVLQAKCKRCDYVEVNDHYLDPLGHSYKPTVTPPSCTEKGYTSYQCIRCTDSYTQQDKEATGHRYGEWKLTKAPTATEAGQEERTCDNCGHTEQREVPAVEPDATDPAPTEQPTEPTDVPTEPTTAPTEPTDAPTEPTTVPTEPTDAPTEPTTVPTEPTDAPTEPTTVPTEPTDAPTEPTTAPTEPTDAPTEPTTVPTEPTDAPTEPTTVPTEPTDAPTEPTTAPTEPTDAPTEPTTVPTESTCKPTENTEGSEKPAQKPEKAPVGRILAIVAAAGLAVAGGVLIWRKKK